MRTDVTKNDWNPDLYLKFERERTQPSRDLVARVTVVHPARVIDIGCGPGNSTQVLVQRWPDAKVTGVDLSPAMIAKAKKDYPTQDWQIADAGRDDIRGQFDLVFSNATIQWIPDHEALIARFARLLAEKGQMAVQVPRFEDMPIAQAIARIAQDPRWKGNLAGVSKTFTFHDAAFYYDQLTRWCETVDLWETHYVHVMGNHAAILEMVHSTGLRPYLEWLDRDADKDDFEREVLQAIARAYPAQRDGKVLFPFKRLFFIAGK